MTCTVFKLWKIPVYYASVVEDRVVEWFVKESI